LKRNPLPGGGKGMETPEELAGTTRGWGRVLRSQGKGGTLPESKKKSTGPRQRCGRRFPRESEPLKNTENSKGNLTESYKKGGNENNHPPSTHSGDTDVNLKGPQKPRSSQEKGKIGKKIKTLPSPCKRGKGKSTASQIPGGLRPEHPGDSGKGDRREAEFKLTFWAILRTNGGGERKPRA